MTRASTCNNVGLCDDEPNCLCVCEHTIMMIELLQWAAGVEKADEWCH